MRLELLKLSFARLHLLISATNSGLVTILTSLTMTKVNLGYVVFDKWLPNWLISWAIVFLYVAFIAPQVTHSIKNRRSRKDRQV